MGETKRRAEVRGRGASGRCGAAVEGEEVVVLPGPRGQQEAAEGVLGPDPLLQPSLSAGHRGQPQVGSGQTL